MPNAIQILQTVGFARWARKEGLSAQALRATVSEIEDGLIDAYLGDRVVKKRPSSFMALPKTSATISAPRNFRHYAD